MKQPNKIMQLLLTKVIMFDCEKCKRYWNYEDYQTHKMKGNCKNDPNATNFTSQLSLRNKVSEPFKAPVAI